MMVTHSIEHASDYPGQDTRPTSQKELWGFYLYSFAAEVFVVCALGAFIPITLEDLARASPSAFVAGDRSRSCRAQSIDNARPGVPSQQQCILPIFGIEINTASFALYSFSVSVLVQAFVVVTMSGAADHGQYRKTLLTVFAAIGSIATMLFLPVTPNVYWLGSLLAVIGNVCFGASFVLLNSFLPLLVRYHPSMDTAADRREAPLADEYSTSVSDVRFLESEPRSDFSLTISQLAASEHNEVVHNVPVDETTALLAADNVHQRDIASQLSTRISALGVSIGYSSAVIVQMLSILILVKTGATLFSLRIVLFFVGFWWLAFTIPAVTLLRPRPGPPLPMVDVSTGKSRSWAAYIAHSWINLGRTISQARRLRDVLLFLAAWFMISDAVATVSGTAILYAKTTLGMKPSSLAVINVIVTICGITGALTWSKVSRLMQLTPSQTITTCICIFEIIPIYALLSYIPAVQRLGFLGLQQQWEVFPVAAVYGLVLGGLSSYCRSLFGELIPPGNEAAFYALYAITDKGSSIFGPVVVGAITDYSGEIRPAFWFLAILIALPIPIMSMVDVERGKREGAALARDMKAVLTDESMIGEQSS